MALINEYCPHQNHNFPRHLNNRHINSWYTRIQCVRGRENGVIGGEGTFGIAFYHSNLSTISADLKGCGVNNADYTGIFTGKLKLSKGLHIQNSTKLKSKTKQT
jgi:hypothetical protein